MFLVQDFLFDVGWNLQLLWGDQYKADALVAGESSDERMNGASKLQVAAQTDGHVVYSAFELMNGHQVGQRLGWMLVTAVTGIDNWDWGVHCSDHWSAFLWMAHSSDVRISGDNADGIRNAFAFGSGGGVCGGESNDRAAQLQHCRLKAESCAGAWFIEEGCQLFAFANLGIFLRVFDDVIAHLEQLVDFFDG